ncbi:MAG: DNA-processing protein DprA [Patescibacteria group bacterium]
MSNSRIETVHPSDQLYPPLLKEIYHPPTTLYYIGSLANAGQYVLSVVGTRKPSTYGLRITDDLVTATAQRGVIIVSGLAYGIDARAHAAALAAGGKTWAVMASGLDRIYPAAHRALAEKIVATGGALISDYPPGTEPLKQHFPARNRIIAGLSLGTLIIEAPDKSGALITANFALDYNREVLAVPGQVYTPSAVGTNRLIKQGAKVVTEAADILEIFGLADTNNAPKNSRYQPANEAERRVLDLLRAGPQTVDQICEKCKLGISTMNSTLSFLEMSGAIIQLEPQTYALNL